MSLDEDALLDCLARAEELNHDTEDIQKARELIDKFQELEKDAFRALQCVSMKMIDEVLRNAEELKQNTVTIQKVQAMKDLSEKEFVQEEYRRAAEVGDEERRIHREIRLMELKYEDAGKSYNITAAPKLRSRQDYSKNAKAQEFMLVWEKKAIKNTLIKPDAESGEPDPEKKARVKEFKKQSKLLFKNILMYMGDKKSKDPDMNATEVLRIGVEAHRKGDDETLAEIYMLIIKQLRNNPKERAQGEGDARNSTSERGTSFQNGLQLLGMCLSTFPPSTEPFSPEKKTFDDYVAVFVQNNISFGGNLNPKKYMSALHNTKYGKKITSVPNPAKIRKDLAKTEGLFSIDYEADSGPKEDAVKLYENVSLDKEGTTEEGGEEGGEEVTAEG